VLNHEEIDLQEYSEEDLLNDKMHEMHGDGKNFQVSNFL